MRLPPPSGHPYRISMVCLGNICRSPMAAIVLQDRLAGTGLSGRVQVDSAGTGSWHVGDQADPRTRDTLARRGYDGESHRARQVRPHWFDQYDLILVMDQDNLRDLQRMAPDSEAAERVLLLRSFDPEADDLAVPDPYYGTAADFEAALTIVERAVDGLLDALTTLRLR